MMQTVIILTKLFRNLRISPLISNRLREASSDSGRRFGGGI